MDQYIGLDVSLKETAISVRLHDIAIVEDATGAGASAGERQPNEAAGRVIRQAYLGSYRDYLVRLADGREVRVTAPLGVDVPVGGIVHLHFPPEHCRALAR